MKIRYDQVTDTLTVRFSDKPIVDSDEQRPGVILDFDADGNIVGFEVLDASAMMPDVNSITWEIERHGPAPAEQA